MGGAVPQWRSSPRPLHESAFVSVARYRKEEDWLPEATRRFGHPHMTGNPKHPLSPMVSISKCGCDYQSAVVVAPPDGSGGARPTFSIEGVDVLVMELLAA